MSNFKGKRMVSEDLIKKLEDLEPGTVYTPGTGIKISIQDVISVDTDTIATKSELFSGDYDDLTNKPDLSVYAESANLATVATTGDYDDLTDKPSIPSSASSTSTVTPTTETLTFTYSDNTTGTITFLTAVAVSTTTTLS